MFLSLSGFTLEDCSSGELGPFAFWMNWHSLVAWGQEEAGADTEVPSAPLCTRNVHPDLLKSPRSELQKQLC